MALVLSLLLVLMLKLSMLDEAITDLIFFLRSLNLLFLNED